MRVEDSVERFVSCGGNTQLWDSNAFISRSEDMDLEMDLVLVSSNLGRSFILLAQGWSIAEGWAALTWVY